MEGKSGKHNWTVEAVAEAFHKESFKIEGGGEKKANKMESLDIRKKVQDILKESDCPESVFRKGAKKQDGHFIFWGDESVPEKIYRIFEFYDAHHDIICGSFMSNEENELMTLLFEVRPNDRQKPCNNTYTEHRRELKKFYFKKYSKIYEQKFFIKINVKDGRPGKHVRSNIYHYQAFLVREWFEKWSFIMKVAMSLRINERILNGFRCDLKSSLPNEEDRKRFYIEGRWFDELEDYLKKDRLDEDEMYNACCNLYYFQSNAVLNKIGEKNDTITCEDCRKKCLSYVKKIFSHPLLETSIDDFLYMQRKAIAELEKISVELEEELEIEKEYDEIICGLKQIIKMVSDNGLERKKNKELDKILDKSIKRIGWQDMSDEICKVIKNIVNKERDPSEAKKQVIDFCNEEIKKYSVQLATGKKQSLTYT